VPHVGFVHKHPRHCRGPERVVGADLVGTVLWLDWPHAMWVPSVMITMRLVSTSQAVCTVQKSMAWRGITLYGLPTWQQLHCF
jgi:hypothetical protein